ncbi:hypothetical protein CBM2623_B170292 [Cupriavidus taiwanensis]|nr:hypothetical protein CBM2623_B170292 [Cupriavidus taiwanensis]
MPALAACRRTSWWRTPRGARWSRARACATRWRRCCAKIPRMPDCWMRPHWTGWPTRPIMRGSRCSSRMPRWRRGGKRWRSISVQSARPSPVSASLGADCGVAGLPRIGRRYVVVAPALSPRPSPARGRGEQTGRFAEVIELALTCRERSPLPLAGEGWGRGQASAIPTRAKFTNHQHPGRPPCLI